MNCICLLLYYCTIVLFYYCTIVLLYYCTIVLFYYCTIVLLYYCTIVLLYYCTIVGCRESRDEALLAEIAGNYEDEKKPLKEAYYEQFAR